MVYFIDQVELGIIKMIFISVLWNVKWLGKTRLFKIVILTNPVSLSQERFFFNEFVL